MPTKNTHRHRFSVLYLEKMRLEVLFCSAIYVVGLVVDLLGQDQKGNGDGEMSFRKASQLAATLNP